jgi:FixJ family two-component response regulator
MATKPLVGVVDDDESVRESLPDLLTEFGFSVQAFSSAEEFLASAPLAQTRCLILDIGLPGISGPELQQELAVRKLAIPIIFITARIDESLRQRLLARGAVAHLQKPFAAAVLREALRKVFPGS